LFATRLPLAYSILLPVWRLHISVYPHGICLPYGLLGCPSWFLTYLSQLPQLKPDFALAKSIVQIPNNHMVRFVPFDPYKAGDFTMTLFSSAKLIELK
jgi:hypothetical protein